jgi:uncharacterized protein (DUF2252 family)
VFPAGREHRSLEEIDMIRKITGSEGTTPPYLVKKEGRSAEKTAGGDLHDTFNTTGDEKADLIPSQISMAPAEEATSEGEVKSPSLLSSPQESTSYLHSFNEHLQLPAAQQKEKYDLMKSSALNFFRGTPALFVKDMKGAYKEEAQLCTKPAPEITVDGDMHLGNFGIFMNHEGDTVWGINDQDQAGKGSPEYDLIRLATSITLLGRKNGLSVEKQKELVGELAKKYCEHLEAIAAGDEKGQAWLPQGESHGPVKDLINTCDDLTQKDLLEKFTAPSPSGTPHFACGSELKAVSPEKRTAIDGALREYEKNIGQTPGIHRPMRIIDVAEKLGSGGSSYGLPRYFVLVESYRKHELPVIIEMKQLLTPAVVDQEGDLSKADGKSIIEGQKKLGGFENPLTGYTSLDGKEYMVREREAVKGTLDLEKLDDFDDLWSVVKQAGHVLARAHGHTQTQARALEKWIGDYSGMLANRLTSVALKYANQAEADHRDFKKNTH